MKRSTMILVLIGVLITATFVRAQYNQQKPYHGVVVPFSVVNRGEFTDADYQRISDWGCNAIYFLFYWSNEQHGIEPYENQVGFYNEVVLTKLDGAVSKARGYGLKPFIGIQNSFDQTGAIYVGWADVYGGDHINTNPEGRQRYVNMLSMLAERYLDVGIDPWAFPYHQQAQLLRDSPSRVTEFYSITQPLLLDTIRQYSDAPVVLNPLKQGIGIGTDKPQTNTNGLDEQPFYDDPKVHYGYATHSQGQASFGSICRMFEEWDYDMEAFNNEFKGIDDFKARHPTAQFCCIEFCGLYTETISQSRLDWARAQFEMAEQKGSSWFYHRYVPPSCGYDPEDLFNDDGTENEMAKLIQEYA